MKRATKKDLDKLQAWLAAGRWVYRTPVGGVTVLIPEGTTFEDALRVVTPLLKGRK